MGSEEEKNVFMSHVKCLKQMTRNTVVCIWKSCLSSHVMELIDNLENQDQSYKYKNILMISEISFFTELLEKTTLLNC